MRILVFALVAAILAYGLQGAQAQTKRAFVVGVGDYETITDLKKTVADADGYTALFRNDLDFKVTRLTDPTRAEFAGAFGAFLETIQSGDEVVFVFSGHGWSDGAENYLVLADAPREASEFVLKSETIPLTTSVLRQIKARGPRLTFAVIDACRDYPFDSFTMNAFEKGLVRTEVSEGTLVLYAAGSRQKALDRLSADDASRYSVFTRVLLPKLRQTDRPLQDIARDVKDEVRELARSINHVQRPAYYDELLGDYCLAGRCRESAGAALIDADTRLWLEVSQGQRGGVSCDGYRRYLSLYPDGRYASRAEALLGVAPCSSVDASATTIQPSAGTAPSTPGATFRDELSGGGQGPEMVVVPVGSFMMGSPPNETGRADDEGPQKRITIGQSFAVGKHEVTVAQFDAFVRETGYDAGDRCQTFEDGSRDWRDGKTWRDPGFSQTTDHPVVCVSWDDAKAYAAWLSRKTGETYRLLTEAEWEYAARAGTTSAYAFGDSLSTSQANHNKAVGRTTPAGQYPANGFGLYDVHGNVWEWVEDCWTEDLSSQRSNGATKTTLNCPARVFRGGSWGSEPQYLRSANRSGDTSEYRDDTLGFRLARTL